MIKVNLQSTEKPIPPFPEEIFLPAPYIKDEYEKRCRLGRTRMADANVLICGLARCIESTLDETFQWIEHIGSKFRKHKVCVFENDSADNTAKLLKSIARKNKNIFFITEELEFIGQKSGSIRNRFELMAKYRNRYLVWAKKFATDIDFAIVVDFDLYKGFSIQGLQSSFGYEGWDAMFSNGITAPIFNDLSTWPMFYDALAFRRPNAQAEHPRQEINSLVFRRGEPPLRVASAFGGMGLYTGQAFLSGAGYSGGDCEHVTFHTELARRGFERMFLNPSQIVFY